MRCFVTGRPLLPAEFKGLVLWAELRHRHIEGGATKFCVEAPFRDYHDLPLSHLTGHPLLDVIQCQSGGDLCQRPARPLRRSLGQDPAQKGLEPRVSGFRGFGLRVYLNPEKRTLQTCLYMAFMRFHIGASMMRTVTGSWVLYSLGFRVWGLGFWGLGFGS